MPTKSYLSFTGFILLMIATYCPLLRPFGFRSMNLYDLHQPFGIVVLLVAVIGILGVVLKQRQLAKLSGWAGLLLVVLLFIAAFLKIHNAFSFIPFEGIAGYLTRQIKYKWGWYLLFAAPILAIIGNATTKSGVVASEPKLK